jgi:uncharacterized membrane protein YdjX (TVP38/TMEM64 family)
MLKKYIILLIVVLAAALIFWQSVTVKGLFFDATEFLSRYAQKEHQLAGVIVFIMLAALSAMLSPFSTTPLIPAAVLIWGVQITFYMLLGGWMLGAAITYAIGYYAGRPFLNLIFSYRTVEYYQNKLAKRTTFLNILLFRLALPAEIPGYVLGIMKYNFTKYMLATGISEAIMAFLAIFASNALLAEQKIIFIITIALIFAIFAVTLYLFRNGKLIRK